MSDKLITLEVEIEAKNISIINTIISEYFKEKYQNEFKLKRLEIIVDDIK